MAWSHGFSKPEIWFWKPSVDQNHSGRTIQSFGQLAFLVTIFSHSFEEARRSDRV